MTQKFELFELKFNKFELLKLNLKISEVQNMKNVFTKEWLKAAAVRAVKTVAQTAVATIGAAALLDEVAWLEVLSASVLAGVLSLLTSVAGIPEVDSVNSTSSL